MKAANLGPPQTPLGRKEIGKEERENKNKNRKRKLLTWGRHQHPGDGKKTLTIFSPHLSPTLRVCTYMCMCVLTFKPLSHSSCVYLHSNFLPIREPAGQVLPNSKDQNV